MIGSDVEDGKEPNYVSEGFATINLADFNRLKRTMDRISDALLCLDATMDTLKTILETHESFYSKDHNSAPSETQSIHLDGIVYALTEKQRDVALARKKAEALFTKAKSTQILVSEETPAVFHPLISINVDNLASRALDWLQSRQADEYAE